VGLRLALGLLVVNLAAVGVAHAADGARFKIIKGRLGVSMSAEHGEREVKRHPGDRVAIWWRTGRVGDQAGGKVAAVHNGKAMTKATIYHEGGGWIDLLGVPGGHVDMSSLSSAGGAVGVIRFSGPEAMTKAVKAANAHLDDEKQLPAKTVSNHHVLVYGNRNARQRLLEAEAMRNKQN
jgi:hypothetical protein